MRAGNCLLIGLIYFLAACGEGSSRLGSCEEQSEKNYGLTNLSCPVVGEVEQLFIPFNKDLVVGFGALEYVCPLSTTADYSDHSCWMNEKPSIWKVEWGWLPENSPQMNRESLVLFDRSPSDGPASGYLRLDPPGTFFLPELATECDVPEKVWLARSITEDADFSAVENGGLQEEKVRNLLSSARPDMPAEDVLLCPDPSPLSSITNTGHFRSYEWIDRD